MSTPCLDIAHILLGEILIDPNPTKMIDNNASHHLTSISGIRDIIDLILNFFDIIIIIASHALLICKRRVLDVDMSNFISVCSEINFSVLHCGLNPLAVLLYLIFI